MGDESVDISVIEYFKTGESLDKKKKKEDSWLVQVLRGRRKPYRSGRIDSPSKLESSRSTAEGRTWNCKACWKPTKLGKF